VSASPSVLARLAALEERWEQEAREAALADIAEWLTVVEDQLGDLLTWTEGGDFPNEQTITDKLSPVLDHVIGHKDCKLPKPVYDDAVECVKGCIATIRAMAKATDAILSELPRVKDKLDQLATP